jgi:hypothetical protein
MDYEVINSLGQALFERAKQIRSPKQAEARKDLLEQAADQFEKTLKLDSENVVAHYGLRQIYPALKSIADSSGDQSAAARFDKLAKEHGVLHERYKPDDNARDVAEQKAKEKYPAAAKASEPVVIYPLNRIGAPGLANVQQPAHNLVVRGSSDPEPDVADK